MTEDEAFIRTIVDRPGDDLPRLVYADWLDERNDPRGAYLRAELEWAKAKQTAGFIVLRLDGLAEGLDPVWVARVSRPPVGVCCDHLTFLQTEQRVSSSDIDKVEVEFGLTLPPQCRALLLNYNGGDVVRDGEILETPEGAFAATPSGWWFHPLWRTDGPGWEESSIRSELRSRYRDIQRLSSDPRLRFWCERYLQIGTAPPAPGHPFSASILVAVTGKFAGNVWISQGNELNDPAFDIEHPPSLQPLSQLLSVHPRANFETP